MKRLLPDEANPNSRTYWNHLYEGRERREQYAQEGTLTGVAQGNVGPTTRFSRALEEIRPDQKVLDIGCGVGVFTKLVKMMYPKSEVWGTDISDRAMFDNTNEVPSVEYRSNPVGNLKDIPKGYFDVVFSGETLEHLDDPKQLFVDAADCLKPGGKFILTTPNGRNIQSPEHVWEFNHDDIEGLYLAHGFDRVRFIYLSDMEHLFVIMAVGSKK